MQDAESAALAQMGLDYLSAPGESLLFPFLVIGLAQHFLATSVDAERLFSFSGATVTKLRNQLSEDSARAAVMVGQWAAEPDLIAVEELEHALVEGWSRGKKRKAGASAEGERPSKILEVDDTSTITID